MNPILFGLIFYLLIVLFIGFRAYNKNKTQSDYLIADRKLGPWAISLSERASGESAWLLIGLPGAALAAGYLEIWAAFGCLLGIFFSWMFLAIPLRNLAGKYNSLTLPDLMSEYFKDENNTFRIIASIIITFFFTFYVAAQFNAAGKVLNVTFGISQLSGMILGAGIIIFYTLLGGFFAVVWTDMIQAFIMFATLVILPVVGYFELQSLGAEAFTLDSSLLSFSGGKSGLIAFTAIIGGLSWGLGYTGQPHLLARFIAIRESEDLKRGRIIAFSWAVPAFIGAFFMGIIGLKLYGAGQFTDPEQLMPYMATMLLPGWIAGILISGAIAAMMSTADSQLLVTTSVLTEDIIHKTAKKDYSAEKLLSISRIATVLVGIIAFFMAYSSTDLVFSMVSYAWSGLGASFGPVLVLMIYWPKITRNAAIWGMISGALSTIIWKNIDVLQNAMTERLSSYLIALLVIVSISLIEGKKSVT